jgi:Protein of unknown function (DUF551)
MRDLINFPLKTDNEKLEFPVPEIKIICDLHQWVDCSERLPYPKGTQWLVYDNGSFHVATYLGDEEFEWFNGDVQVNPTHWMPLPFKPNIPLKFKQESPPEECPECGGDGYTTCCGVGCTEPSYPDSDICAGCYEHTGDVCDKCDGKGVITL